MCKKDYSWNSSTCTCENSLKSTSVTGCCEIISAQQKRQTLQVLLQ